VKSTSLSFERLAGLREFLVMEGMKACGKRRALVLSSEPGRCREFSLSSGVYIIEDGNELEGNKYREGAFQFARL
jgi:hypothetical protein